MHQYIAYTGGTYRGVIVVVRLTSNACHWIAHAINRLDRRPCLQVRIHNEYSLIWEGTMCKLMKGRNGQRKYDAILEKLIVAFSRVLGAWSNSGRFQPQQHVLRDPCNNIHRTMEVSQRHTGWLCNYRLFQPQHAYQAKAELTKSDATKNATSAVLRILINTRMKTETENFRRKRNSEKSLFPSLIWSCSNKRNSRIFEVSWVNFHPKKTRAENLKSRACEAFSSDFRPQKYKRWSYSKSLKEDSVAGLERWKSTNNFDSWCFAITTTFMHQRLKINLKWPFCTVLRQICEHSTRTTCIVNYLYMKLKGL